MARNQHQTWRQQGQRLFATIKLKDVNGKPSHFLLTAEREPDADSVQTFQDNNPDWTYVPGSSQPVPQGYVMWSVNAIHQGEPFSRSIYAGPEDAAQFKDKFLPVP